MGRAGVVAYDKECRSASEYNSRVYSMTFGAMPGRFTEN